MDSSRQEKKRARLFRRVFVPFSIAWVALTAITALTLVWIFRQSGLEVWPVLLCLGLLALAGIAISAWLASRIARAIAQPLRRLIRFAERTGQGETGLAIHLESDSELSLLGRAFNRMSDRLARQIEQIDRETAQLRAILDGMVEGVVALDANERLLFVNERAVSLLDLPAKNPVGRRFWELVRVPELLDAVSRAVKGNTAVIREMEWPGTPSHSLTIQATPLSADSQTQIQGAVVVVHDTTELKRLDRLRRDFVANVSHELKTPLSVIKLCAETLDAGAMDDPEARGGFLSQIIRQSERLSFLIVDLLTIARIEGGREMLRPQALEVAEALADCAARHREQAEQRRVQLLVTPLPADLWIWMDEEALTQILDNLVANAIRYNHECGSVTLSAKAVIDSTAQEKAGHIGSGGLVGQAEQVEIEVADTGVGIPEADLPRIFERFFRVEKARSRDLGGTGLGLSIVKHLVTASQGSIVAKSSLGRGSVFTLRLPRVQAG